MKVKSAEFIKSAKTPSQYPPPSFPEIAFAGRSNVGKSTLINVLTNRKKLAATSATPGKTRLVNFFLLNGRLGLVDLPGYGYAKVPMETRKEWAPMVESYLRNRPNLKLVILLIDSRRIPSGADISLIDWLNAYGREYCIVVTKADKLSRNERKKQGFLISNALGVPAGNLIFFSAASGDGKGSVWKRIQDSIGAAGE